MLLISLLQAYNFLILLLFACEHGGIDDAGAVGRAIARRVGVIASSSPTSRHGSAPVTGRGRVRWERRRRAARGHPEPSRAGPGHRAVVASSVCARRLACAQGGGPSERPGLGAGAAWEGSGSAAGARRTRSGSRAPTWSPLGLGIDARTKCAGACPRGRLSRSFDRWNGGQRRADRIRGADRAPRAAAALSGPPGARVCTKAENARIH